MRAPVLNIEALAGLAPRLAPGAVGVGDVRALSGGASQELWAVSIDTPDGPRRLVLRRAPEGRVASGLSIPIEAEARVMRLAHAHGVPTPRVVHTLAPEDGLGAGFFMEHVDGEALGGRIVRDEAFASVRPLLARQCGEVLARIHALPRAEVDLPASGPREVIDALEGLHRSQDWPRPVFELAFQWLRAHAPQETQPRVVHGDFRNGNLMIGERGVQAVLDWELAHVGDAMEDLGWICVNSWRFGVTDKPVGGFGAREELYAGYESAGGRVDRPRAHFWEVLGTLRWGVMCTLSAMALKGEGPFSIERPVIARRASETELDLLNLLESAP
jgi:aminoglycoside phosphotransferase (APT) family kinase protein